MPVTMQQRRYLEKEFASSIREHPDRPVVVSEGDSWFSFPTHRNIIDHLDALTDERMSLLRLEDPGEELLQFASGSQRSELRRLLKTYPVDALLLSGGGNDIAGDTLFELLRPRHLACPNGAPFSPSHAFFVVRLERCMRQLLDAYHSIADLRDEYRPNCVIATHGYAYAIPSGKKSRFLFLRFGPWLQPSLLHRGYTDESEQNAIIRFLIDRFNDILQSFSAIRSGVVHVDLREALADADWNDELHLSEKGFLVAARELHRGLCQKLPSRFVLRESLQPT